VVFIKILATGKEGRNAGTIPTSSYVQVELKFRMTVTMTIAVLQALLELGRLHKLRQAEHEMAD
jgi:hypothetical protein